MNTIFIAFYLMFLTGCLVASVFIIYHITRYSINKKSTTIMTILFISVLLLLILINLTIFGTLDLSDTFNFMSTFGAKSSSF
ncbi:MAG: hypothetical protein RBS77_00770 [Candidatus Moranbacteria bacterium]|jgi:hypothetical protein|nr:hypothetical protein [Candidatus Moranbacteria bacterium]